MKDSTKIHPQDLASPVAVPVGLAMDLMTVINALNAMTILN